ncbi:hypothetical protein D6764_01990 [Candidatus Woesearchaeota archaeon]|nr:MAG: hypothetical protein D6764_01990 [Candidatus Woesearchaeota archaeon]
MKKKPAKTRTTKWSQLSIEWKVLVATFLATSVFLFIASLQIVSHARTCETKTCVLEDITTFTMTSFFVLCIDALVLAGFLVLFYWRRYSEIKSKHAKSAATKKKGQKRRPKKKR